MENTKTDGISSGLVAVAWLTEVPNMLFFDLDEAEMYCVEDDPIALVRLSDAEAKLTEVVTSHEIEVDGLLAEIAAKDAEIERLEAFFDGSHMVKQAERIKELEAQINDDVRWIDRANEHMSAQSAALKLARDALRIAQQRPDMPGIVDEALAAIDALGE